MLVAANWGVINGIVAVCGQPGTANGRAPLSFASHDQIVTQNGGGGKLGKF